MEVYHFNISRNKAGKGINSSAKIRKLLINECNGTCSECGKVFDDKSLDVEHCIPVALGGSIFDVKNLRIWCVDCHNKKTHVDKRAISALKRLGVVYISPFSLDSLLSLSELHDIYTRLFELGMRGIDYQKTFWSSGHVTLNMNTNREEPVKDGRRRIE